MHLLVCILVRFKSLFIFTLYITVFSMGDTTFIADFEDETSSSEDELKDDEQPPPRTRRRTTRTWLKDVTYESSKEAEQFVQSKNIRKIMSSTYTPSGKRVDYRCMAAKYRVNECRLGSMCSNTVKTSVFPYTAPQMLMRIMLLTLSEVFLRTWRLLTRASTCTV